MNNETRSGTMNASPFRATYASYIVGFLLSIALTLVPYFAVADHLMKGATLIVTIVGIALVQLWVQLVFFLHLSRRSDERWNVLVFVFTALIVLILVVGSLWIMYHLNYNMMLSTPSTIGEGTTIMR